METIGNEPDGHAFFTLSAEAERELLLSIAEADRGEILTAEDLQELLAGTASGTKSMGHE